MKDLQDLKIKLQDAKSIVLVTVDNPNKDCVAASLGLYLSLLGAGKDTIIASNSDPIVRDSHLVGVDKIATEIGNTNLVITFDIPQDAIEKVSYNDEAGKFNLVIEPKKDTPPITKDKLNFSYSGATADLLIVIGASSLQDAGSILEKEENLTKSAVVANISNQSGSFGAINITDPKSSLSELITALIKELGLQITPDAANNLMLGIQDATGNLQSPNMTADTFEALALLYRAGARMRTNTTPQPKKEPSLRPSPSISTSQAPQNGTTSPTPDWLKPKIYKGSTRI